MKYVNKPTRSFRLTVKLLMDFESSTESLLRDLDLRDSSEGSVSTRALINENYITNSTGSLVHERVQELLNRVHIPDASFLDSDSSDSTEVSLITSNARQLFETTDISDDERKPQDSQEQIDPLLSILYNKIQVFLLRNRMSLEFLKIFKIYVSYLIENGLNPIEDQYFLSLQNELSESFEFSPTVEDILNKFLLRPENMIMKLALFEHGRLHSLLQRHFKTWILRCTMRRSLHQLEVVWLEYIRRKYILLWARIYQTNAIHMSTQADDFARFTVLSTGFDKWIAKMDTNKARKGLADHYFLDHIFQHMKKEMKVCKTGELKAQVRQETKCLSSAMRAWILHYRKSQCKKRNVNLQAKMLGKMSSKLRKYRALQSRAKFAKYVLQTGPCFRKWYSRSQKASLRSQSLVRLEEDFIKKRAFCILKDVVEKKQQESVVENRLNVVLMDFIFKKVWLRRYQEQIHVYSFWSIQNERLARKYLEFWKTHLLSSMKAYEFSRAQRLKEYLTLWRREMQHRKQSLCWRKSLLRAQFLHWSYRASMEEKLRNFKTTAIVKCHYLKWKGKAIYAQEAGRRSRLYYDHTLISYHFRQWHHSVKIFFEMNERSDILRKFRALSMVKRGLSHMRDVGNLAEEYDPILISKEYLRRYVHLWKDRAVLRRDKRLEDALQIYELGTEQRVKMYYLRLWMQKIQFYDFECVFNAEQSRDRALQRRFLIAVEKKLRQQQTFLNVSGELRNQSLLLSALYSWKGHFEYVNNLHSRLDTEINKRNLALLLNYLNVWSMRILKSRRNYETVQIFRRRWDRAVVRGMLFLWKNRADHSPKKLRSTRKQNEQQIIGSELVTPIRAPLPKNNTIPGSEGVKQYRIEAMKSHYSRVRKAIPSPIKSSTTLNSTAKKKIDTENEAFGWNLKPIPPPRLSLERINKNLASKIDRINFERIPEVRLDPFMNSDPHINPVIDRSLLEVDEDTEFDESPTRRT